MTSKRFFTLIIDHSPVWRPLFGLAGRLPPSDSHPDANLRTTLEDQGATAAFVAHGRHGLVAWAALHVVEDDHPVRECPLKEALAASSTCLVPPSVRALETQLGSAHRIQAIRLVPLAGLSRPAAVGQVTWTWQQADTSTRVALISEAPYPHPFSDAVALMDELAQGLSWSSDDDPSADTYLKKAAS